MEHTLRQWGSASIGKKIYFITVEVGLWGLLVQYTAATIRFVQNTEYVEDSPGVYTNHLGNQATLRHKPAFHWIALHLAGALVWVFGTIIQRWLGYVMRRRGKAYVMAHRILGCVILLMSFLGITAGVIMAVTLQRSYFVMVFLVVTYISFTGLLAGVIVSIKLSKASMHRLFAEILFTHVAASALLTELSLLLFQRVVFCDPNLGQKVAISLGCLVFVALAAFLIYDEAAKQRTPAAVKNPAVTLDKIGSFQDTQDVSGAEVICMSPCLRSPSRTLLQRRRYSFQAQVALHSKARCMSASPEGSLRPMQTR
mmetsp:Transcript_19543/g.45446  ORF Transcript_19543/g.45446 Transcript_19543/m.45446 type:complete len:312 (-) Transcript_19543:180-1115(-)